MTPRPSPAPTVVQVPLPPATWTTHVVHRGDTLWGIGRRYGVTTDALVATNPQISDPRIVPVGDEILIPPADWTPPVPAVADGAIVDSDFDGTGDLVLDGNVEVGFNPSYWPGELRGVYEFDLRSLASDEGVTAAHVLIPSSGTNKDGADPNLLLYAGPGDGRLDAADFAAGRLVGTFNVYQTESAMYIDLTETIDRLRANGASFVTLVLRPNPAASGRQGAIFLGASGRAQYGDQLAQLTLRTGDHQAGSPPAGALPYVVVQNIRFPEPDMCSFFTASITNYGDAALPAGWGVTVAVPSLGRSDTAAGQTGLAPGQRIQFGHNAEISKWGVHELVVSAEVLAGRTKAGHASFRVPCRRDG
jgi:LysM repeat protein